MRALVKLGNGKVVAEIMEKRPHSCLVRLPDNHVIVRKNWQINKFIGVPATPKISKPKAGFWKKILAFFRRIWYTLSGAKR